MIKRGDRKLEIKNAEYNRDRMHALQTQIIDGDDAEAVYKYAYRLKKEVEEETLELLLSNEDITEQRNYYKVVCRFVSMLEHAAANGKRKEKVVAQMRAQG